MRNFLIIPVAVVPEWTKSHVPTYSANRFSTDGQFLILDDAHPETTYLKWLGPNAAQLPEILAATTTVTWDQFKAMEADPLSIWYEAQTE